MSKSKVLAVLKEMGLKPGTISFYVDKDGNEQTDTEFGDCEICGVVGDLVSCTALGTNGKKYSFQALTALVHGPLGKVAGAF